MSKLQLNKPGKENSAGRAGKGKNLYYPNASEREENQSKHGAA